MVRRVAEAHDVSFVDRLDVAGASNPNLFLDGRIRLSPIGHHLRARPRRAPAAHRARLTSARSNPLTFRTLDDAHDFVRRLRRARSPELSGSTPHT